MWTLTHADDLFVIGQQVELTNSFQENMSIITSFWKNFQKGLKNYHFAQEVVFQKYGITFRKDKKLYYACAIPYKDRIPNTFSIYRLPRATYLTYPHQGSMLTLPTTISYLMKEVIPQLSMPVANEDIIYYEYYDATFHWNDASSQITLGIPLKETPAILSIPAKTILQGSGTSEQGAWNWFGMDYNMNLYKGCPHGCIYCDSRSSCYQVHDFDNVRTKENELAILEMELKRKKRKGIVGIGAMSDTYHPAERNLRMTRGALELLYRYGFGVGLDTKSDLILDDIPILQKINKQYASIVKVTITTADDALCRKIEPHVVPSSRRFEVLETLHQAGIFAGVLLMPILPFINDTQENIKALVYQAHLHHAKFIYAGFGVTLRDNQRAYFYYCLDQLFPGKRELYEANYQGTYSCDSPHAKELYALFKAECEKYGILYRMKDIIAAYKHTRQEQLSLLP